MVNVGLRGGSGHHRCMGDIGAYTVLSRLNETPYATAPLSHEASGRMRLLLRAVYALEAAGLVDDTAGRSVAGSCVFCDSTSGQPHTERCPVPRCVITGSQRLMCKHREDFSHDCGRSTWDDSTE